MGKRISQVPGRLEGRQFVVKKAKPKGGAMLRRICSVIVLVLAGAVMWSCSGERVTTSPITDAGLPVGQTGEQVGQPLSKPAVSRDVTQAVVVARVHQDGVPVSGATVEFSRSVSGRAADYAWSGTTDESGEARVEIGADDVSGYYQARAMQEGSLLGSWSSIPINGGYESMVDLPVGGKARVIGSSVLLPEPEEPEETIVFSDLNWTSAQMQNRIAQYIVEKGYGYPTDLISGSTLPLFDSLRRGETHVFMEVWLPNQEEGWAESQAAGEVINVGPSLGNTWQSAFVIPAYLQEQYPDLDSVEDLKEDRFKNLFVTEETGGKARLMSCISGWGCAAINVAQVEGYGLSDHVHLVTPEDAAALDADLYSAYEKREPWLGYQWGTSAPALFLDLVRLEEPAFSDECWDTNKACAYEDPTILIAVHSSLPDRAADVVEMLRAWGLDLDLYKEVAAWRHDNPEASTNDAALWWLRSKADLWSDWVTSDAAIAIRAALVANEIPDGWPEE